MSLFSEFARMQRDMHRMMHAMDAQFDRFARMDDADVFGAAHLPLIDQPYQARLTEGAHGRTGVPQDAQGGKTAKDAHDNQTMTTQQPNQQQVATMGRHAHHDIFGLSDWLQPFGGRTGSMLSAMTPAVDILARDDRYTVKADLPAGVAKENVRVDLDTQRGVLTLSGQQSSQHEEKDETAKWVRRERSSASFTRSLRLPNDCDISAESGKQMTAKFNNGVLELDIPRKKAVADPKLKETTQRINIE